MKLLWRRVAMLVPALLGVAVPHHAHGAGTPPSFLPGGSRADPPSGFVEMCRRDLGLCASGGAAIAVADLDRLPRFDATPGRDGRNAATAARAPSSARIGARAAGSGTDHADRRDGMTMGVDPDPASPLNRIAAGGWRDDDGRRLIHYVNGEVNRHIVQVSDFTTSGVAEYWKRPDPGGTSMGDCEDIAIEKRMQLLGLGFPADRLFFGVVYKAGLGLHTVLVARLDSGDVVLDSASSRVERWWQAGYIWLRQQSPRDALEWRSVSTPAGSTLN
ncbi:transglutaminase-like cysteine peptidase [soil metagenome]